MHLDENKIKYIDDYLDKFIEDFRAFLRQPSISAQNLGVKECADLLKDICKIPHRDLYD